VPRDLPSRLVHITEEYAEMKRDDYDDEGDLVEHNEALAIAKQARQYLLTPTPDPTPGTPVPPDERPNDSLQTMDARVWAAEFMKITGGAADESTMLAWFANALMCGWDHHYWRSDEYKREVARFLGSDTMATPTPTPGTLVPPDKLREQWIEDAKSQTVVACYGSPIRVPSLNVVGYCIDRAAAWGQAQAMQERAELRELLIELAKYLETPGIESGIIPSKNRKLADRARAAAERLSPSAQEKNDD